MLQRGNELPIRVPRTTYGAGLLVGGWHGAGVIPPTVASGSRHPE